MTKRFLQFTLTLSILASAIAQPVRNETRTFQLLNATTEASHREMKEVLRFVAEVSPDETADDTLASFTVSGSPDQLTAAAWIVKELDSPPGGSNEPTSILHCKRRRH